MASDCLIIIDMLNDFLDRWESSARTQLVANTNELIATFRAEKLPVIWVKQEFRADLTDAFLEMRDRNISITIEDTQGAQFDQNLHCGTNDIVIVKKRYSAFFKTNLEELLGNHNIKRVTLAGVNTHACIRMAAIDAYQRDIRVEIASDCIGSLSEEHARVSLEYLNNKIALLKTNSEIITNFRNVE